MTKLLFRTALIELMQEKPFHKITVKEICEQADLNRTTFYLHYSDQTQLLDGIVSKLEEDTSKHFASATGNEDDIENPYVQKFIISGYGSTIFQWINNGFDMETRDLAKLIYNLCKKATA